jgi:hypothetical protein
VQYAHLYDAGVVLGRDRGRLGQAQGQHGHGQRGEGPRDGGPGSAKRTAGRETDDMSHRSSEEVGFYPMRLKKPPGACAPRWKAPRRERERRFPPRKEKVARDRLCILSAKARLEVNYPVLSRS